MLKVLSIAEASEEAKSEESCLWSLEAQFLARDAEAKEGKPEYLQAEKY